MIKKYTRKKGYNGWPFETTIYYPVCDKCGCGHNGTTGFTSESLAVESAKSHGWSISEGLHICSKCRTNN